MSISKNRAKEIAMQSYTAEQLTSQTVKALNVLAKSLGMVRYSKLRKADLIAAIVEHTAPKVTILDTEEPADHAQILAIMAQILPVTFSDAPAESAVEATQEATPTQATNTPE